VSERRLDQSCRPPAQGAAVTAAPVLLLLHQQKSCAGSVGYWLRRHGYEVDVRRPTLGQPLPETLARHSAVIVFGGPMSANDDRDDIRREIDWLAKPLRAELPFLGICLGAQMMVRQLGGRVAPLASASVEVGYHDVRPTPAGHQLFDWPKKCFQWHREGFEIPSGAVRLAAGKRFENQAYRYGRATYGVQFHPEITELILRRWSVTGAPMLKKKGAHKPERLFHDHLLYAQMQRHWLHQFMSHWTSLITAG
jgi:GMP synthase (glutamine-hydrolysing)